LIAAVLALSGRQRGRITAKLSRFRMLRRAFDSLRSADAQLARNPRLLILGLALQLAVVLLDSATVWLLIQSLGVTASPLAVFTSFMISSLFRSIIAFVPGGLGTFEASSVLTLKMGGIPLPVALSTTLLFRGLSLWLPMIRAVCVEFPGPCDQGHSRHRV
jgi:Mg2+-importing ATPase